MSSNLALLGEFDKMCEEGDRTTNPPLLVGKPRNKAGIPYIPQERVPVKASSIFLWPSA